MQLKNNTRNVFAFSVLLFWIANLFTKNSPVTKAKGRHQAKMTDKGIDKKLKLYHFIILSSGM